MKNKVKPYPVPANCDFCGSAVIFTSNSVIYGKEFGNGKCYKCTGCDCSAGVHDRTEIPLSRLADKEMRDLKKKCHALFDPVWQESAYINRSQAYGKLANVLNIPVGDCHFGWFDKYMLLRCMEIMSDKKWYIGVNWK